MTGYEILTITATILIPMLTGFGFIINKLFNIDSRLSRIEGYIEGRDVANKKNGTEK